MSIENQINRFARVPVAGDRVLLRVGRQVIAVGEIPADETGYAINSAFFAVLGWELGHSRRVIWNQSIEVSAEIKEYVRSYKQMATFFQIQDSELVNEVAEIDKLNLLPLPIVDSSIYSSEDLSIQLFNSGMSNQSVDSFIKALEQARRLYSWYHSESLKGGRYPTEHEVVSHMVLPILLALGWSHQQIAVEWNKVDIALFSQTPTTKDNCKIVIEVKGLGKEMGHVLDQPLGYIQNLGLTKVEKIVVTDGNDYFISEQDANGNFATECSGYININRLQREYALPRNTNVLDTLSKMRP